MKTGDEFVSRLRDEFKIKGTAGYRIVFSTESGYYGIENIETDFDNGATVVILRPTRELV